MPFFLKFVLLYKIYLKGVQGIFFDFFKKNLNMKFIKNVKILIKKISLK